MRVNYFKPLLKLGLVVLPFIYGEEVWALSDTLFINATNPMTQQVVVFNLQRYNLRGTNYQVRIYSDATNYTLLPTNQIPEVTTYRGRIPGDPGAMVFGAFEIDGTFDYSVSYGCRWQIGTSEYDFYDGTNRLSWDTGTGLKGSLSVPTTNLPSLGYVTNYAVAPTNIPQNITWSMNNYPTNPAVSYGGPPYLNNLKQVPLQRARLLLDSDFYAFTNQCQSSIAQTVWMQESRINLVDYDQARDLGICYQIVCVCVRTNTQLPYIPVNLKVMQDAYWAIDPGWSQNLSATSGWFDMAHGTMDLLGSAGIADLPGDFTICEPWWSGRADGHEMGHNWGQSHGTAVWDYTGTNWWHVAMDGSGCGYSTVDANTAQSLRRNNNASQPKGNLEWVKYNCPVPPHATPDFATTKTNQAVSINVLLNDYIATSNALTIVSFETNTLNGGTVTSLGNGVLQYTPATNFVGYDMIRYYVAGTNDLSLKSLTAAKVLVTSDANPLLGEWQMNDTNGNSAAEATGNGQAATLCGSASFTTDSTNGIGGGTALHLDGAGYVRFQGTWFDSFNTNASVSIWVKPDVTPMGEQMIFSKSCLDNNGSPGVRLGMNGSSFFFTGATVAGQSSFSVTAAITPQPSTWYHLVGEIDRGSGLIRLFVNGVEYTDTSNTRTIPAGEFIAADMFPMVGAIVDNSTSQGPINLLIGTVDDVRFYTKALSLSEVQTIYNGLGLQPATSPMPAAGSVNVVLQPTLTWQPGTPTNFQYDVYLGTSASAVAIATTNSAEFQKQVATTSFAVTNSLATNTTCFWRVDEVLGTNVVAGSVWSFTTTVDSIHGGLALYLSLDARDTVGTNTYDRAGPPFHDGVLYSSSSNFPATVTGQVHEGLSYNGTNSYVESPALFMNTSNATFLAWINSAGAQNNPNAGLVFVRNSTMKSGLCFFGTTGRLGHYWNSVNYDSGLTVPNNQWVFAAVSVGKNGAVLFLGGTNGILQAATNSYTPVLQAFDAPLDVACNNYGSAEFFKGAMDEVCVWNRALSAAEIGQIFTNGIYGVTFAGSVTPVTNTFTWTGNSDVYWTNPLNWATNGIPGAGNTVYFNDAAYNTGTQLGGNVSVAGINISGGTRSFGISGTNTLTLGGGGIAASNSVAAITFGTPTSLSVAQTWSFGAYTTATLTGALSGAGNPALTITGGGTVNLNNGNSYSGTAFINGGTVSLKNGNPDPSLTGNVSIGTNGTLIFNGAPYGTSPNNWTTNYGNIVVNGQGQCPNLVLVGGQVNGPGYLRDTSGGNYNSLPASQTAYIGVVEGLQLNVNTSFNVNHGAGSPSVDMQLDCPILSSGGTNITKSGSGTLLITQPANYTGNTIVSQGTLQIDDGDNILPTSTTLSISNGAAFTLNDNNQSVVGLNGSGIINLGAGSVTELTVNTDIFGGVITGNPNGNSAVPNDAQTAPPGGFGMAGAGKIIFTNVQAYVGDTWVLSGTLALSGAGSLATSSNLVVEGGATLDANARTDGTLKLVSGQKLVGFGTVTGKVAVTNGAVIAPGDTIGDTGTLAFNSTLNLTGGQALMKISKSGGTLANDLLTGITTLTCSGTLTVNDLGPDALAAGDSFKIFNATTFAGSFTNLNLPLLATNLAWDTSKVAVNGTLAVIVPAPPVILSGGVNVSGGNFNFQFSGTPGWHYRVEFAPSLPASGPWPVVTDILSLATSPCAISLPDTNGAGFYRVGLIR